MFEKSSQDLALHKLMILYILNKIEMALTNSQLTQIVMENEIMNYFALQQFILELEEGHFTNHFVEDNKDYMHITHDGLKMLEFFMARIPEDLKDRVDKYIETSKEIILKEMQIKSDYLKKNDNEFIVNLKVIENQSYLINIDLNVASKEQAKSICDNWKQNAENLYGEIIEVLIK